MKNRKKNNESPCPSLEDLIVLGDGEMDSQSKERMEKHIRECPVCRKRFFDILALDRLIKAGDPAAQESSLMEAGGLSISEEDHDFGKIRERSPLVRRWGWVAAAACILITVLFLYPILFSNSIPLLQLVKNT